MQGWTGPASQGLLSNGRQRRTLAMGWRMIAIQVIPHVCRPYDHYIRSQHVGKEAEFQWESLPTILELERNQEWAEEGMRHTPVNALLSWAHDLGTVVLPSEEARACCCPTSTLAWRQNFSFVVQKCRLLWWE